MFLKKVILQSQEKIIRHHVICVAHIFYGSWCIYWMYSLTGQNGLNILDYSARSKALTERHLIEFIHPFMYIKKVILQS